MSHRAMFRYLVPGHGPKGTTLPPRPRLRPVFRRLEMSLRDMSGYLVPGHGRKGRLGRSLILPAGACVRSAAVAPESRPRPTGTAAAGRATPSAGGDR